MERSEETFTTTQRTLFYCFFTWVPHSITPLLPTSHAAALLTSAK